jgi:hypothetical protein
MTQATVLSIQKPITTIASPRFEKVHQKNSRPRDGIVVDTNKCVSTQ